MKHSTGWLLVTKKDGNSRRAKIVLLEVLQSYFLATEWRKSRILGCNIFSLYKYYNFISESLLIDLIFTKLLFALVANFFGREEAGSVGQRRLRRGLQCTSRSTTPFGCDS